jgi:hypothetical protein
MKSAFALAVCVLMTALAADASAQGETIGAKVRRWQAEIRGDMKVNDGGSSGSSVDVENTFGFSDEEDFDEVHFSLGLPVIGKFNFQYLQGGYEGDATLSSDITFGDTTFTANTPIHSELDFKAYTLLWAFGASTPGVVGLDAGGGMVAGFKYFDIHANVNDPLTGTNENADIAAPLPVIGAYFRTALMKFLSVEAQVHGIKYFDTFGFGVEGLFYDATIAVDLKLSGVFGGIGYRMMKFDFEYEDDADGELEFDMTGLFFQAGIAF